MRKFLWLSLLVAPLGCGDSHTSLPAAQPNKVVGTFVEHCLHGSTPVTQPVNFQNNNVGAFVKDDNASSGFSFRSAIGHPDGTFEIDDVPEGARYYLQIDSSELFETDQRVIDANVEDPERCGPDPTFPANPVAVTVNLDHMTPFASGDVLSPASYALSDQESFADLPQVGATSVTGELDWFGFLPDGTLGDDFTILHTHDQILSASPPARSATTLVDVFTTQSVTLKDGVPAAVSGSFTPVPAAPPMTISLDATPYVAPFDPSKSTFNQVTIEINAGPQGANPFLSATLGDLGFGIDDPTHVVLNEQVAYGDPFPASWKRSVSVFAELDRTYEVTPTQHIGFATGGTQTVERSGTGAPTFLPMLPPPTGLTINGLDGNQAQGFTSALPAPVTVAWQPSAGATDYQLVIWHLPIDQTQGFGSATIVSTDATQIALPGQLFSQRDGFFVFTLAAQDNLPDYGHGRIFADNDNLRSATIASGRLRFSPSCGDGKVDPGEDCDDKGESATCNADCTAATCGDGVLNATAGETCDTIDDTATCDAQTCALIPPGVAPSADQRRAALRTRPPVHRVPPARLRLHR